MVLSSKWAPYSSNLMLILTESRPMQTSSLSTTPADYSKKSTLTPF